jgi:NAD(P)-dependent dehydrogenase (short-subunit alcohol dehydrogenase family)
MTVRFDGRVAVVTGAGRGLGREFALALAERGAAVVVNDIGTSVDAERYDGEAPSSAADEVVATIRGAGGRAVANAGDVSSPEGAASMVDAALAEFGGVDIIINNAGVVITNPFGDLTLEDLIKCHSVHVVGTFNVSKAAWSHMAAQQYGRILNVCSVDGVLVGNASHAAYDAAKGGVAGLTRGMAEDGKALSIKVNGLLPGAWTRGHASTDASIRPTGIDMRPSLVAPAAGWLVHEDCAVTGRFYAASSGRMGRVFTAASIGYQTHPDEFTLEAVNEHWETIDAPGDFVVPDTTPDYNAMRRRVYESVNGVLEDDAVKEG